MNAYIFPGQGAQFVGMGLDLYEKSDLAKELFEQANEILGFKITDRRVKRAGLDYWKYVQIEHHSSLEQFLEGIQATRLFFFSTKGKRSYVQAHFQEEDFLVFGSETSGLPEWILEQYSDGVFRIPILCSEVRSLNLSNAVSIITYEALRQTGKLL